MIVQMRMHSNYFNDFWNIVDFLAAMLTSISLALTAVYTQTTVERRLVACFQAVAGLFNGFK
eukprot:COSAG01_NODE_68487_length_264_cov_0.606061_1_plen_61_part_10